MSKIEVNQIGPQCGTTLTVGCGAGQTVNIDANTVTLGRCGATVSLAAGATQSGFGRTGTVDWDTTAKTANFTAVSGTGYFVNTTSAAITLTLPATPSAGDIVAFKDYAFTFATNNLTVDGNGSPIGGVDGPINPTYSTNGTSKTFIYVDGTKGWLVVNDSTDTSQEVNPLYVTATGGTVTCCGDYKIHTFTGPGTFCVSCAGNPFGSDTVDYLVVAGGGAGGNNGGGGGGGGGFRMSNSTSMPAPTTSPLASPTGLPVSATTYPITVGGGGAGFVNQPPKPINPGSSSIFSTITSAGGGGGGSNGGCSGNIGGNGGSGGGGAVVNPPQPSNGAGTGNTPPTSPPQGNNGGLGYEGPPYAGGGGGGAGAVGGNAPSSGGAGGVGSPIATTFFGPTSPSYGTPGPAPGRYFAGGGGGGINGPGSGGTGGSGGGGAGSNTIPVAGGAGTVNTGGGAGGGGNTSTAPCTSGGGAGGSGIVLIRYKFQ